MDLTFHIIFVPRTFRYLRLAVLSLLKYSKYRYRLVSNGLDRRELLQLRQFCQFSDRLECFPYPTRSVLPHGIVLSLLQQREPSGHFCFMDPDIFASSTFDQELESHLHDCDVFSSCDLVRVDSGEILVGYEGRCRQTPTGLPLALTYFAVYRNDLLRRVIMETGVGFEAYNSPEHYTDRIKVCLANMGLSDLVGCDTGKLLNVLSHAYDMTYKYRRLSGLTHIGGITAGFTKAGWLKERLARFLRRPYVLRDEDIEPSKRVYGRIVSAIQGHGGGAGVSNVLNRRRVRLRRRRVATFFAFFLQSLIDGTPEPVLALRDSALSERIGNLCAVIRSIHAENRPALAA